MDNVNLNIKTNIQLTPKAKEFLEKVGERELYIESVDIDHCCMPITAPPIVRKGKPLMPEKFEVIDADGYSVYYDRSLSHRPQVTVDVEGFSFTKRLGVTGWEIRF